MKFIRWTTLLLLATALIGCRKKNDTFTTPPTDGATPWTHMKANASDDEFQFAVVSDRAGGRRPGVFSKAIDKVNLLQPEFVICVGDLITGAKETEELNAQWDEFDERVNRLEMPFFYVAGNHDIFNKTSAQVWAKRYGTPYYHFLYQNCLFLVVCTEDAGKLEPSRGGQISGKQIAYLKKALADNADARWTFVFLHKPLFVEDKKGGTPLHAGWAQIEEALKDRPHTAFAGHWHSYCKYRKHGQSYFRLATTGGGSALRGPSQGTFDHFMWITMKADGPRIANIALDGVHDENIVTEESLDFSQSLLGGTTLSFPPIFVEGSTFRETTTQALLKNVTKHPLRIQATFAPHATLKAQPEKITVNLAPGQKKTIDVRILSAAAVNVDDLAPLTLRYSAQQKAEEKTHRFDGEMAVGIVRKYDCPRARKITVDGKLDDWPDLPFDIRKPAAILKAVETYAGPEDCRFRFATSYDDTNLYIAVEVFDDKLVRIEKSAVWDQDGVEIRLLALPEPQRSMYRGGRFRDILPIVVSPEDKTGKMFLWAESALPKGTRVVSKPTKTGYTVEAAIPASYLDEKQGQPWKEFRLSLAVDDCDQPGKVAQLWWAPDLREKNTYAGSGTFRKK